MRKIWAATLLTLLLTITAACAEAAAVCWLASDGNVVRTSTVKEETYLFLPSHADETQLSLVFDVDAELTATGQSGACATVRSGEPFDLTALSEPTDGVYRLKLTDEQGASQTLCLMFSANVRSLYLTSDDAESYGREWVEDCDFHERQATGSATLLRADGSKAYSGELTQIRGRGNSTWVCDKRPYQLKFSKKADLLETGEPNKKWVLLAESYDGTLLHNRVTYALGRELGLAWTPDCEPVDLYYDGEYRGVYMLAEKSEVGKGRVELEDYDELLEKLNKKMNIDLDKLEQVTESTEEGYAIHYTEGVEDADETHLGGYLVEMDQKGAEETTWFALSDGMLFAMRSPEIASKSMVLAVCGQLQELNVTLQNYGVNPDNGKTWDELLDVDSWLPFFMVNEFTRNPDCWNHASTFFTIPAGGGKVSAGPLWDFDLSYLNQEGERYKVFNTPKGLTQTGNTWGYNLYRIPEFQVLAHTYYSETLEPLVRKVLLGDENAAQGQLHSISWYWAEMAACRAMNTALWGGTPDVIDDRVVADSPEENYAMFREFVTTRTDWLAGEFAAWQGDVPAEKLTITMEAPYGNVSERTDVVLDDIHANARMLSAETELLTEATENDYAVYRTTITVAPKTAVPLSDGIMAAVNGTSVPCERQEDGTVTVSVTFEDPSYRVAEYEGVDYGLVFDAAYYAEHYPEIVEEVGDDPQELLAYYADFGIDEGQQANEYFDPEAVYNGMPQVQEMLGENYADIVFFYLDMGYEDWMTEMGKFFVPSVSAA